MAYARCPCEPSLRDRSVWPPVARTVSSILIVPQRSRFMPARFVRRVSLIPGEKGGYGAGPATSARLAILNWYLVTLYPKGIPVRDIPVRASLTLPKGWQAGTALPVESTKDNVTQFGTVSLETFADSPALCGQYFKEIPIGPKDGPPHFLVLACDSAAGLEVSDNLKANYDRLVAEAGALFGARHYGSYRFLVAMSEQLGHNAIEHHESSDNRMPERMMID